MAAPQYVNPLYQAILDAYDIEDDTKPTTNIELAKVWEDFSEDVTRYRRDINADALKSRIADVRARLDYIKSSRDYQAKLEETEGKNARVSAQVFVERMNNLTTNKTRLATQRSQFYDQAFSPARSAFEETEEKSRASASADALFKTLDDRGLRYDPGNPDTAGLATQWTKMVLGTDDLSKVTPEQARAAVEAAGGSSELQAKTAQFIRDAQSADAAVRSANTDIKNAEDLAQGIAAGTIPVTEETKQQALAAARKATLAFQYLVGQDPETLKSQEEELAAQDSRLQMMQERETRLYNRAFGVGGEGLRTKMGRVMANPEFQRWAADNGYELGQSQIDADGNVSYVPGPQDERALLRFAEQARTGRQGGLFTRRRTDELVRVTITNPEERQRLLEANDLGGGRYAVDPRTGSLVSSQAYIEESRKAGLVPQGYQSAMANGMVYIKAPDGSISVRLEGGLEPVRTPPAGLKFQDAIVYGPEDTVRYMTAEDMTSPPAAKDIGYPDANDKQAIEKSSPYKVVTAEQLPNLGVQTFEGYRDKRNAKTLGEMGEGAFSINNGQYTFGKDAKYEVLLADAEDVPGSKRLGRRAAREIEKYGLEGLPREQVLAARAAEAEAPVAGAAVAPSALRVAAGPSVARQEALTRQGEKTSLPEVGRPAAPAVAAPQVDDLFPDTRISDVTVGEEPVPAPAAPAAPAPVEEEAVYFTKNGAVYKTTPRGAVMIQPKAGQTLDTRVIPTDSDAFEALTAEGYEPIDPEEGRALEIELATAPTIGRPTPEITAEGQVTRIDLGQRRPTLEQRIGGAAEKAKEAITGLFTPKPRVSKGREDLPEAAPIETPEDELFPATTIALEGEPVAAGPETPRPGTEPAPAIFGLYRAAKGARGEGDSTLRLQNVRGSGEGLGRKPASGVEFSGRGPAPTAPTPSRRAQIQKAVETRRSEIEERKAAPAGREEFLREVSGQLESARRAAPKAQSQLLIDRGPKPVNPFEEPTETELVRGAESRVAAQPTAEDRRAARKAGLEKFRGVLASAFGRQPAPTASNTTTPPSNGVR